MNNMKRKEMRYKKRGHSHLFVMLSFFMMLSAAVIVASAAAPTIDDWSSNGAHAADAKDIFYLVDGGESITFTVSSQLADTFSWEVDKAIQPATGNSFEWLVPNEKSIWEIHVEAKTENGTAHHEWAVSTLSASEAPVLFDYFSDKKIDSRIDTDPWGRVLPEWINRRGTVDASNCNFGASSMYTMIDAASTTVYGTWDFQFKYSEGGTDYGLAVDVYPIMNDSWDGTDYHQKSYRFGKGADEHLWIDYVDSNSERYVISYSTPNMQGSNYYCIDDGCVPGKTGIGRGWHNMRIVHDTNGIWYMWIDNDFVPYSSHWMDVQDISTAIGLYLVQPDDRRVWLDNIEVHDEPIFPEIMDAYDSRSNTIVVKGWNNTLSSLASDIDDADIFNYNSETKTATCNANLEIARGAQLLLNDEVLVFNTPDPYLEMKPGWNLIMSNSIITTNDINNVLHYRSATAGHYDYVNGWQISDTYGKLIMYNSTIEHVNMLSLADLRHAEIQDSNFLVAGDHAMCLQPASYRDYYLVKNATFTAGSPVSAHTYSEWSGIVYDAIFNNGKMYIRGNQYFVNTEFNSVTVSDYWAQKRVFQNYLDVKVVDSNNDPVSDATVTVTNELDNEIYPAETMKTGWEGAHQISGQTTNWYRRWIDANDLTSTITGEDGHTPLPFDGDDTIIITDYAMTKETTGSGSAIRTNFTYNLTATKDGKTASMSGLDINETWYRKEPNVPKKTVVCNLETGDCWAEDSTTDVNSPTTNTTIIPTPDESGWNNVTPVTVTYFRSDNGSGIAYTNYSKTSEMGPWTTVDTSAVTGPDAGNVTFISEGGFNLLLSEEGNTTIWYYSVNSDSSVERTKNVTVRIDTTQPITNVIIQSPNDVTDNRLKEASPDTVLGSTSFIDVGRISSAGNYRDVIWFDLTQLNTTAVIKTAKLSLFWYYTERNTSTTVEIYRPVAWSDNYVTWNNRTNGVAWIYPGGDWYDRTNVAQGNTPYAALTFPVGTQDNAYHEFDVTELVQSYVSGTYENTGFFIKANEVSNSYIAFRSSDWTNASERPKLVVSYGGGDAQQNTLSGAVTSQDSTTGIADATVTLATQDGTVIDTVQADLTGHYEFTDVSPGDYNINATKHGYWPDSDPVTVNASAPATANIVLCQKGDFNTNSEPADAGDLAMMADATVNATLRDETYDLNNDGVQADAADLTLLKNVSVGVTELE